MASPSPTSDLALLVANLETLIASSATFQAAVGATGDTAPDKVAAAKAFVYWIGQAKPEKRPFAWIKLKTPVEYSGEHSGGGGFMPSFTLGVYFEMDATAGDGPKDRQIRWLNFLGAVVTDMLLLAKTAGMLFVTHVTVDESTMQDPKEQTIYNEGLLTVKVW